MKGFGTVLVLSCLLCVEALIMHEDIYISGCSDTDAENMYGLDGEVMAYADFTKQKAVNALPPFADPITYPGLYESALANREVCRGNLAVSIKAYKNPPTTLDTPHSIIYTRDDVELGVENTLICHVTGFFPAPVTVWWTRNGENVTEGVSINIPYLNKDSTFNQVSRLTFTPGEGDIYSCSVQHRSLTEPLTRIWDVEVSVPSVGPAVFCGVGLTVGLLGVAAGTFFLIKGNECN
ncbi:H-2 class II histocompatibility antigen, A-U alpha chain-like [Hypomesus transpacificus]|uniref:H-2 class II histocompatibility antigen, A-U alpha chain-like n=1 Tax=Hypomesus transpacificus TaxID=137520 RepID=UPI001F083AAA|nr:H-2 class II histocompatibility antigen, A-U alpha chain-like [Hypomesus transpacificus]